METSFIIWLMVPVAAVVLDVLFGEPAGIPHPVRIVGSFIKKVESFARPKAGTGLPAKIAGAVCALAVACVVGVLVYYVCSIPWIGVVVAIFLAWSGLALGALLAEGRTVAAALNAGDLDSARTALAGLCSRDTAELDENGCRRALAETMSENLNDGFVAPMFYLAMFGPAGLWVYKVFSTLDSMWGYKTEEYKDFGWFAARADDVLAFIPARLTGLAMIGAARVMKMDYDAAFVHLQDDAGKTESPNAGWPMAAAAWLVGVPVGGNASYFGEVKEKAVLGPEDGGEWSDSKLKTLLELLRNTGLMCAAGLIVYGALLQAL